MGFGMTPCIRLFGTSTSPYARRPRVILQELALEYQWIETTSSEGQAALRNITPLWKVPVIQIDDQELFDSRIIGEHLLKTYGPGSLTPNSSQQTANLISVIDGAMDALINNLYLGREGITPTQAPYLDKHLQRAAAAMAWVAARIDSPALTQGFGLASISLATTLEWMLFRKAFPLDTQPALGRWLATVAERPSLAKTRPSAPQ